MSVLPDTLLAPARLWLLLLLPVLALLYWLVQRRRHRYSVRFTNLALLRQVAPRRPAWRRHAAAAGLLATVALMVLTFARPADEVRVPRERATVIVTIDVSLSMMAEDVEPSRLVAAQQAARSFVQDLPPRLNVGLVSFAGTASVLVPPTTEREPVLRAIDDLKLAEYTAIGEGIFTSLSALDLVPADPSSPGEHVPGAIVLLSDGETTVGRSNSEAAAAARQAGVPVSTIAFGTPDGVLQLDGLSQPVPVGDGDLRRNADDTGGRFYRAETAGQLQDVYADIGSSLGYVTQPQEVTGRWAGYTLLALLVTVAGSLAWFGRMP
ncbi:MAG: VWA domain-containing protein [Actinomycetes bacterium]